MHVYSTLFNHDMTETMVWKHECHPSGLLKRPGHNFVLKPCKLQNGNDILKAIISIVEMLGVIAIIEILKSCKNWHKNFDNGYFNSGLEQCSQVFESLWPTWRY